MILFATVLHVMVCIVLILVVLLQRGKGAEIGAVFGGGASTTVFGSRGAGNFLTRLTTGAAVLFMLTSLFLSYSATNRASESLFEAETPPAAEAGFTETTPALPVPAEEEAADGGGFVEIPAVEPAPPKAPEPPSTP